ncbi:hypothetical protein [Cellulomonas sp. SLBN-39]|uniref:hypothetical protein n=1 Tax=Cellulomonas sp. SLBN-39 TaxID=2768446 RepID=UPI001152409A|nr:hypothetical protein [Cellulomonas sp. SLBN-39]TQL02824.1 hypothetical protein FBY24_1910 [Cellulomonas sp. SLBN-39]
MSTVAPSLPLPARVPSPARHALRMPLTLTVTLGAWFWVVVLVGATVGTVVAARVAGSVDVAVIAFARQGAIWFPFSLTIALVATYLRVHVAAGMTRRSFVRATLVAALVVGTGHTVVMTVLVLAERALHGALGWDARITDTLLPGPHATVGALLAELGPVLVLANLSGLLVGIVYLRTGGWWGTLALPLTVGPLLLAQALNGTDDGLLRGLPEASVAPAHVLGTALLGAAVAAAYAVLVRGATVRTT